MSGPPSKFAKSARSARVRAVRAGPLGALVLVAANDVNGARLSCSGSLPAPGDNQQPNIVTEPADGQCTALT